MEEDEVNADPDADADVEGDVTAEVINKPADLVREPDRGAADPSDGTPSLPFSHATTSPPNDACLAEPSGAQSQRSDMPVADLPLSDGADLSSCPDFSDIFDFGPPSDPDTALLSTDPADMFQPDHANDFDAFFSAEFASHDGLADMNFGEFWASMGPLIGENMGLDGSLAEAGSGGIDGESTGTASLNINTAKLADDMQSLLSGCVM